MPPLGRRAGWILKLAAGLLIFWVAFRDVDPAALTAAFALVDAAWIVGAALSVFVTVGFVVMRWRVLLGAAAHAGDTLVLLSAVIASQVANIVMPFRLGDAVRIGAVSRALSVAPAEVLGSVAVERLFDALLVAVTAFALVALGALPAFARAGLLSLAIGLVAAVAVAVLLVRFQSTLNRRLASAVGILPDRVGGWLLRQTDLLLRGLHRISQPSVALRAFFWSCCVMAGSAATAWLVLRAFALDAPAASAVLVVIVVQIGSVVVPIPGAVGISQVLTVQTLKLWDIGEAPALAYALVLYLVSRVPKLIVLPLALWVLTPAPAKTS